MTPDKQLVIVIVTLLISNVIFMLAYTMVSRKYLAYKKAVMTYMYGGSPSKYMADLKLQGTIPNRFKGEPQ